VLLRIVSKNIWCREFIQYV